MRLLDEAVRRARALRSLRREDDMRLMSKNDDGPYRLPIIFGNDTMFLTKEAAWVGMRVPNKNSGFQDDKGKRTYFNGALRLFTQNMPSDVQNGGQLLISNRTMLMDEWEAGILDPDSKYNPGLTQGYKSYIRAARKAIDANEFSERKCSLIVRLGARRSGMRKYVLDAVDNVFGAVGVDDSHPMPDEVSAWSEEASNLASTMHGSWLNATTMTRRELEWLTRNQDTPGLPTVDVAPTDETEWGAGAWRTCLSSYTTPVTLGTDKRRIYRGLKVEGPTGTGTSYVAFLPIATIPQGITFDSNWIDYANLVGFPVDLCMHFEVINPNKAEEEIAKAIHVADSQQAEDAAAGETDQTTDIQRQGLEDARTRTRMSRAPLTYWQAVFAVHADSPDILLRRVLDLIAHYRNIDFGLECPNYDQRELYYQAFPGAEPTLHDWWHRTDAQYLAAGQPWLETNVGNAADVVGDYQGIIMRLDADGKLRPGGPFFFNISTLADNQGKAPTEAVIGDPGAGKTVSRGLKPVHEDALRGVTQVVWDPKGDFKPLWEHASALMLAPEKVKVVDLADPSSSITLDAIAIAEYDPDQKIDERAQSAQEVLTALAGEYMGDSDRAEYSRVIKKAVLSVIDDADKHPDDPRRAATMERVLGLIQAWAREEALPSLRSEEARNRWIDHSEILSEHFTMIRRSTLGRLLFIPPSSGSILDVEKGALVIFNASRLKTTEAGQSQTPSTVVGDTIAALMTDYIRSLLYRLPVHIVKSATFDEWHVIKRTSRANALVDWMRRMGRSRRCSVRQLSQQATDVDKDSLAVVWCGWCLNENSAAASCDLLGLEATDANIQMIMGLGKGEFILRDGYGRIARVAVHFWDQKLLELFNTQAVDQVEQDKEAA